MDASNTPLGRAASRFPAAALAAAAGLAILLAFLPGAPPAHANGGPFTIKYPEGDPAARGVPARLDPDLKPGRETRLKVVKEDLKIRFNRGNDPEGDESSPPRVEVSAVYTIENPTDKDVVVDFGFPILRGIFVPPYSMRPRPHVSVLLGDRPVSSQIISNSLIYGLIRRQARATIESGIARNPELAPLASLVAALSPEASYAGPDEALKKTVAEAAEKQAAARDAARKALSEHLTGKMRWSERDAALFVEYAGIGFDSWPGFFRAMAPDRSASSEFSRSGDSTALINGNLGTLAAIGEQKATQLLVHLATLFDPKTAASYEAIFTAWGGDVRERAVDLKTGEIRPREIAVDAKALEKGRRRWASSLRDDPTIYARVDYLDPDAKLTERQKAACQAVLKNLPVTFTFSPMNLVAYQAKFPAKSTQTLTVSYSQYAFRDTKGAESFQVAYVVHPASLWDSFGPIHLEVSVPAGVPFKASVPTEAAVAPEPAGSRPGVALHRATIQEKTGEIFLALDAAAWRAGPEKKEEPKPPPKQQAPTPATDTPPPPATPAGNAPPRPPAQDGR